MSKRFFQGWFFYFLITLYIYLLVSRGFACQQRVLKTFPGPGYLHSEDGVVYRCIQTIDVYRYMHTYIHIYSIIIYIGQVCLLLLILSYNIYLLLQYIYLLFLEPKLDKLVGSEDLYEVQLYGIILLLMQKKSLNLEYESFLKAVKAGQSMSWSVKKWVFGSDGQTKYYRDFQSLQGVYLLEKHDKQFKLVTFGQKLSYFTDQNGPKGMNQKGF